VSGNVQKIYVRFYQYDMNRTNFFVSVIGQSIHAYCVDGMPVFTAGCDTCQKKYA
jgi:hypothetical protein